VKRQGRRDAALATLLGTGATVVITVGQAFLLIPLALQHLGSHLYGAWIGASELLVWVQLLDLGIPNLLTQRIGAAVGHDDPMTAGRWASTGLLAMAVIAASLAAVSLFAAPVVTRWAQVPAAHADTFTACFRIAAVASAVLLAVNGAVGISRGIQVTGVMNAAQVFGALAGLALSAGFLSTGFGLWALPLGLLARSVVSLGAAAWFLSTGGGGAGVVLRGPSADVLRETVALAPAMAAASVGYLFANNTEILLVTTIYGPVTATVYSLTRRAIDGLRSLLDSIAFAAYGGFAHLVTADDRHRARGVLHEILWLRFAAASLCAAVAVAVNRSFVTLLFGAENFGGLWLTTAFALQMIAGGQSFLANYLLRAAGRVRDGSFLLAGEAATRVAAMVAGLVTWGLAAAPFAAAVVSGLAVRISMRWLDRDLPASDRAGATVTVASALGPLIVVALGIALSTLDEPPSWIRLAVMASAMMTAGLAVLWLIAPAPVRDGSLLRWNRTSR
jgi:O-antigen/teichoic acid export membrane protein